MTAEKLAAAGLRVRKPDWTAVHDGLWHEALNQVGRFVYGTDYHGNSYCHIPGGNVEEHGSADAARQSAEAAHERLVLASILAALEEVKDDL
jgi:hypothetical protein